VTSVVDPKGTLEAALALQPDIRQVVVVGGTYPLDELRIAQARREFEVYRDRLAFTYLSDLSIAETVQYVRSLPPTAIVLVLHMFRDGAGEVMRPIDAFQLVARASSVPVYGVLESYLGAGMVGGSATNFSASGATAGELAARMLKGEPAESLAVRDQGAELVYDWTELERWGLSERRVPAGAAVHFRPPGVWVQYGWHIVAIGLICLLEAGLIGMLLFQRSARRRAEEALEERVRLQSMILELSSSSYRLPAAGVDRWLEEWLRRLGTCVGVDRASLIEEAQGMLRVTHSWSADSLGPPPAAQVHEFPWSTSALRRGEILRVNRLAELPPSAAIDRRTWERYNVKSFLAIPLVERDWTIGALSLSMLHTERTWPEEVVTHVRLIGSIFASAFVIRQADQARAASEELSQTLLGVLSSPTAVLDRESKVLQVNGAWVRLGRDPGRNGLPWVPEGGNYLEVCTAAAAESSESAEALRGIEAVLAGDTGEFRSTFTSSTGEQRLEMIVAPLGRPEGGKVISFIDSTDLKRAEREATELRQAINHLGRVVALGELSASLTHELSQPLAAILSNVQAARRLLASGPQGTADVEEILTDIELDNRRAVEVIRRLRALMRKEPNEWRLILLHDTIREVAELLSADVRIRQVAIRLELDPTLPPVRGDHVQLAQVILNLMMNGADAMQQSEPATRELLVRTARHDQGSVMVSVQDRGTGVAARPIERVFEPFYTSKTDGLGMGLCISQTIIQAHGGRIWASNNSDRGATFAFVLPVA
jgi:C4-dicarboxylate-specific signal transduction histidine kinase